MKKRKICVITGSRADYGHLYCVMKEIDNELSLRLQLLATGSHLSKSLGLTYKQVEADGFRIHEKVAVLGPNDSNFGITQALGNAVKKISLALKRLKPDWLVVLGDRYEIFAAAQAALILKIPVAHIGGGDSTEGAFDEALRHSITKMSHLHFVSHEQAFERVLQLGENPETIFNFGSPGLDYIRNLACLSRGELGKTLGVKFSDKNLLIAFHPPTLERQEATRQIKELFAAVDGLGPETGLFFTKSNADPEGLRINRLIDSFVCKKSHAYAFTSLGSRFYLSLMRQMSAVVGNSSSGLYEAPSFKIPTVNIGERQKGRVMADSVISCPGEKKAIGQAIRAALELDCSGVVNPYGDGQSAERIVRKLKEIKDPQALLQKSFFILSRRFAAQPVYIVAEAGVNHNGSLFTAEKLVDAAKDAGADAVKFQSFRSEELVTQFTPKADYQLRTTDAEEAQWEMIKKLELDERAHYELYAQCRRRGIEFLSTPFDTANVDLLAIGLGVKRLKVPSGEITNGPLLIYVASTGLPVLLSTGMANMLEIEQALSVLAYGYLYGTKKPAGPADFQRAGDGDRGRRMLKEKVTLLHCTSAYPAPYQEINLSAMDSLHNRFGLPVGLSDHSLGISVPFAAVARGARVIEKHFTLDRNSEGPDHRISLEPFEFRQMVEGIRQIEQAVGSGEKLPSASELLNRPIVRRSLVANMPIKKGDPFNEENLSCKRPGTGVSPMRYWEALGRPATHNYQPDEVVKL